jgi:hypothetical protein
MASLRLTNPTSVASPWKGKKRDDDKPPKRGRGTDKQTVVGVVENYGTQ